jgi:malonyl CoA-acyl carrier protein transacylase
MGAGLFERFPALTSLATDVLGYDLPRLCLEDPDGRLDDTRCTQPALYVVNALSYLASLEDGEPEGTYLLGHSLGEYNALLAAGAYDFETGLKLVIKRGELMARAEPGGMLAVVGMEEPDLARFLTDEGLRGLDIANLNTPAQTVLSGPAEDIARAAGLLEDRRVRTSRLRVSAAFHSRYMEPARAEFRAFLEGFRFAPLRGTVIANITAQPYSDGEIARLLSDQISGPVRWADSIRLLLRHTTAEACREAGGSGVLTRMLRQIAPPRTGTGGAAAQPAASVAAAEAPTGAVADAAAARRRQAVGAPVTRPRLFCVAYAGGDERAYAPLAEHCPDIEVVTLERPGRGRRMSEPLLRDTGTITDDLLRQLRDRLDGPYALYGHSLGARLAFLLCRRLRAERLPAPRHLIVSGECGPALPSRERDTWRLPTDAFWDHLKQLGGLPGELFDHQDLMAFYERILRADFEALGSYTHRTEPPLDLPVTVLTGYDEWFTEQDIGAWQQETRRPLTAHRLPGGHFFIRDHWAELARIVGSALGTDGTADPLPTAV